MALGAAMPVNSSPPGRALESLSEEARAFHESLVVVDGHCDTLLDIVGDSCALVGAPARDFLARSRTGHVDFPRLKEGGTSCQVMALFTKDEEVAEAYVRTHSLLDALDDIYSRSPDFFPARRVAEIRDAKRAGRIASLSWIEGGEAIGEDMVRLREFRERGVRGIGLTWNRRNALGRGAGSGDPALDGAGGLTKFGREVVGAMEDLGMIVDASHLSDEALDDLLAIATRPVVATHSNSRALKSHRRNLDDRGAERIAATGGLVGITFAGVFVDADPAAVTVSRIVDHLEHFVRLLGAEHVGIGSDFDGFTERYGLAFGSCAELPLLTAEMLTRGMSREAIAMVMGGSWLRVLEGFIG